MISPENLAEGRRRWDARDHGPTNREKWNVWLAVNGSALLTAAEQVPVLEARIARFTETVVCEVNGVPAVRGGCLTHGGDACLVVRGRLIDRADKAEADLRALAPLVPASAEYVRTTPTYVLPRSGSNESVSQNAKDKLVSALASIPAETLERIARNTPTHGGHSEP